MLIIFKYTSNQEGIKKVKNKIKAHLLEIRLFKDDFGLILKAQRDILRNNLTYMKYSLKPMLVMIIPLILIIIQLDLWFGRVPITPGEPTIVKITLKPPVEPLEAPVKMLPSDEIKIETPPLRIIEKNQINWRIRPLKYGKLYLEFEASNKLKKEIIVDTKRLIKLSYKKVAPSFIGELLNPGESPLDNNSIVKSIEVKYPSARLNFFGLRLHWLIVYFILSILFGFSLKRFLKVEI
jgi:uncharacterized membrane protein (DUF106 family)